MLKFLCTLASKSGCFALQGKRVYITPHIKPNKEVVASLVTAVHGQVCLFIYACHSTAAIDLWFQY